MGPVLAVQARSTNVATVRPSSNFQMRIAYKRVSEVHNHR